jgi:hypothetical protein
MARGKSLSSILVALAALILVPAGALACSCAPASREQMLADVTDIFVGKVTGGPLEIETSEPILSAADAPVSPTGPVKYEVDVDEVLKGSAEQAEEKVMVITPRDAAACGVAFTVGNEYLIFAQRVDEQLRTNICLNNVEGDKIAAAKAEVMQILDARDAGKAAATPGVP